MLLQVLGSGCINNSSILYILHLGILNESYCYSEVDIGCLAHRHNIFLLCVSKR